MVLLRLSQQELEGESSSELTDEGPRQRCAGGVDEPDRESETRGPDDGAEVIAEVGMVG